MNLNAILGAAEYEMRRLTSPGRLLVWVLLAMFPVVLTLILRLQHGSALPEEAYALMLTITVVYLSCSLAQLLIGSPAVSAELEGNTWSYIACRPGAKMAMLLGKYLVSVAWAISVGLFGLTASMTLLWVRSPSKLWLVMSCLVIIASLCYGAVFIMIGTVIQSRAMGVAVTYLVLGEGVLSFVPAAVNEFLINYRMRSMLVNWMGYTEVKEKASLLFSDDAAYWHFAYFVIYIVLLLAIAMLRVRWGEYPMQSRD